MRISKNLRSLIHADMMKPHGEEVRVIREKVSFKMTLNGIRSLNEECSSYADANPGTLRIEDSSGNTVWPVN